VPGELMHMAQHPMLPNPYVLNPNQPIARPQLYSVAELALQYGVKMLAYGGPGTGKTPMIETIPDVILGAAEPGLLSAKAAKYPVALCNTYQRMLDFANWVLLSQEARQYYCVALDSFSEMSELTLTEAKANKKDNRQAYGELDEKLTKLADMFYFAPYKHVFMICKEEITSIGGVETARPYFPGKALNAHIPHRYDEILHVEKIPYNGQIVPAIRTRETFGIKARDRSNKLNEFEPTNIGAIINKIMRG
jgi:hypothetical protein